MAKKFYAQRLPEDTIALIKSEAKALGITESNVIEQWAMLVNAARDDFAILDGKAVKLATPEHSTQVRDALASAGIPGAQRISDVAHRELGALMRKCPETPVVAPADIRKIITDTIEAKQKAIKAAPAVINLFDKPDRAPILKPSAKGL